ncbi:MAG: hypothetical protein IPF82_20285 [Blastocatellia bacterium]|nr:hypothetical protein [Blastocatellia bacterium]
MTTRRHRWVWSVTATMALLVLASMLACARSQTATSEPAASSSTASWDAFAGGNSATNSVNSRAVPVTPIEITGAPYVRSIKLAWSASERVPTYEVQNQTLRLPAETRQAVLQVAITDLPSGTDLRVDWYHGEKLVFSDALTEHEDGDHFFALVKRNGSQLEKLPPGEYRAVVHDGASEIKVVRFQIDA